MSTNDQLRDGASPTNEPPTPAPLTGLTGFERDLLFVVARLSGSNPCGVEVQETIERYYDEDINQGRLYQNLRDLVDCGLVQTVPIDGRSKAYRLTDRASERLVAHRDWETKCLDDEE
jgi:DNA-binding PadR family transcriptional regulator